MTTGDAMVIAARGWIGTPYRHQARGPSGFLGGVDCVGLVIAVAVSLGLMPEDYDPTGYALDSDGVQLREEISKWCELIAEDEDGQTMERWEPLIKPGDLLVFNIISLPRHVAIASEILYGNDKSVAMIHSYNVAGKVVEHNLDARWAKRLIQVWRING